MKHFYTAFLTLLIANAAFAGTTTEKNSNKATATATTETTVEENATQASKTTTLTICACQLLSLTSHEGTTDNVVLLAEKNVNGGNSKTDRQHLKMLLKKENGYMKTMFFESVKVVNEQIVEGDCQSSIEVLKTTYGNIVVYDVLDGNVKH